MDLRALVSFRNSVGCVFRMVAESDLLHEAENHPLSGNMDAFGLLQEKRLIHAAPPTGIVAFVL
jgi:hypothetical protein